MLIFVNDYFVQSWLSVRVYTRTARSREAWSRFARKLKFDQKSLMIFNRVKYKQAKDSPRKIM